MLQHLIQIPSKKKDVVELCSRWKDRTPRSVADVVSAATDRSDGIGERMLVDDKVDDDIVEDIGVEEGRSSTFAI